jgi:hypothetical protein
LGTGAITKQFRTQWLKKFGNALPLASLRACDFFESSCEPALKTKGLMASGKPENQKSHKL